MIYVIALSIWGLIDLPLRADFLPAHPSDCFAIDLPNVPVSRAAVGVAEAEVAGYEGEESTCPTMQLLPDPWPATSCHGRLPGYFTQFFLRVETHLEKLQALL